ncbi:hypothetical protein EYF80_051474 [Liparis tanakae]|uniref:Uncharacterized protein n=1 Tax=Liparis tanakae TaxID=230148 RepID=A0A4Z2FAT5_9TELE|nr:hypothetical protein EYF80_051474 [Liparis tanakae]
MHHAQIGGERHCVPAGSFGQSPDGSGRGPIRAEQHRSPSRKLLEHNFLQITLHFPAAGPDTIATLF